MSGASLWVGWPQWSVIQGVPQPVPFFSHREFMIRLTAIFLEKVKFYYFDLLQPQRLSIVASVISYG